MTVSHFSCRARVLCRGTQTSLSTLSPDLADGFCISLWTVFCYHFKDWDPVKKSCPVKPFKCFAISKGFIYSWWILTIVTQPKTGHATQNNWKRDVLQCFTLTKDFYHSPLASPRQPNTYGARPNGHPNLMELLPHKKVTHSTANAHAVQSEHGSLLCH